MQDRSSRRPSPSLVIALIALFVAVAGGSAVALKGNGGARRPVGVLVAYAHVEDHGNVVARSSKRVSSRNVRLENFNAFCFRHLKFTFKHVQVSPEYDKGDNRIDVGAQVGVGGGENTDDCGRPAELAVITTSSAVGGITDNDPEGFYIAFYR
jgi:hypothetical protein